MKVSSPALGTKPSSFILHASSLRSCPRSHSYRLLRTDRSSQSCAVPRPPEARQQRLSALRGRHLASTASMIPRTTCSSPGDRREYQKCSAELVTAPFLAG